MQVDEARRYRTVCVVIGILGGLFCTFLFDRWAHGWAEQVVQNNTELRNQMDEQARNQSPQERMETLDQIRRSQIESAVPNFLLKCALYLVVAAGGGFGGWSIFREFIEKAGNIDDSAESPT